jgi:nitrate/TMAO reductase-like tetraheme cytochrome c subunit
MRNFLIALTRNPVSLVGSAITTASVVIIASLFALDLAGFRGSPYLGILAYLVLPAFFVLGLVLIPIGIARERRRAARAAAAGEAPPTFPVVDLNRPRTRNLAMTFLVLTLVNVVVLAAATYKGVETMESTEFCGATCHTVMQPEYTAYQRSPHARVGCVDCHIGPGADWFVKSKLSGAWQVIAVTFDLYPRPIPTPIENLRPARETCEQCHWPTKFVGDRLKVIPHFASDEANTALKTVLLLRVGGIEGRQSHGIHWHVDPGVRIRYRADERRETIREVEMTLADGTVKTFLPPDDGAADGAAAAPAGGAAAEWRVMDCMDCHNRPSHTFRTPEQEVDHALADGRLDRSLPYLRRQGLELLRADHPSHEAARAAIPAALADFYRAEHPELAAARAADVAGAGEALAELWTANVFPEMDVTWGSYPNHIGHNDFPGCFRCHDDQHTTAGGEAITSDCSTCHNLLAMEEEDPAILAELQP